MNSSYDYSSFAWALNGCLDERILNGHWTDTWTLTLTCVPQNETVLPPSYVHSFIRNMTMLVKDVRNAFPEVRPARLLGRSLRAAGNCAQHAPAWQSNTSRLFYLLVDMHKQLCIHGVWGAGPKPCNDHAPGTSRHMVVSMFIQCAPLYVCRMQSLMVYHTATMVRHRSDTGGTVVGEGRAWTNRMWVAQVSHQGCSAICMLGV